MNTTSSTSTSTAVSRKWSMSDGHPEREPRAFEQVVEEYATVKGIIRNLIDDEPHYKSWHDWELETAYACKESIKKVISMSDDGLVDFIDNCANISEFKGVVTVNLLFDPAGEEISELLYRACGHTPVEIPDYAWECFCYYSCNGARAKTGWNDWRKTVDERSISELDGLELMYLFMDYTEDDLMDSFWSMPVDVYVEVLRRICPDRPLARGIIGKNCENLNKRLDALIRAGRFDLVADGIIPQYARLNPRVFVQTGHADLISRGAIAEWSADRVRGFIASGDGGDPDWNVYRFHKLYDALKEKDMLDELKPLYDGLDDVEDMVAYACLDTDPDWQRELARIMYGMKRKEMIP